MTSDRLQKLQKSLEIAMQRRLFFAEGLGRDTRDRGEIERFMQQMLAANEAVKVLEALIAEEKSAASASSPTSGRKR
jgi:hypothetical protein